MRILATGDWHIHNYPQFARPWREGLNIRVKHIVESLAQIPVIIKKYNIDAVAHLGDWNFNASNDYRLVNVTKQAMEECSNAVDGLVIGIHGNHDTVSGKPENHNNYPYLPYCDTVTDINGVYFYSLGFNDPLPVPAQLPIEHAKFSVFLIHKDLVGGQSSKGFIFKNDGVGPTYFNAVYEALEGKAVFLAGHYHKPQRVGKVIVVGAPVQHNRGDMGQQRGVVIFDTDTPEKFQRVAIKGPKFFEFAWSEIQSLNLADVQETDYISIVVEAGGDEYREAKKWARATGLLMDVIIRKPEEKQAQVDTKQNVSLLGEEELLKKYLVEKEGLTAAETDQALKIAKGVAV